MWKPVYVILGLMIGLLILVSGSALSPAWEGLLEGIIVIAGLGLITLWLDLNPATFIASPAKKSGFTSYEYFSADGVEGERAETFQPYAGAEVRPRQAVIDHRAIRDLVKEREENSKWLLN